jgi:hypothetical protein
MASLEEIRAKLLQQQNKAEGNNRSSGDSAMFPFWNTPEGGSTLIRFLPDGDPSNTFFWAERLVIKLPFQGIKGDHNNEVIVQVPCMEMYGETCPILAETRPWWKGDQQMQDLARRYWKKKSYLFQGFVVKSDFEEKDTPAEPNPQVHDQPEHLRHHQELADESGNGRPANGLHRWTRFQACGHHQGCPQELQHQQLVVQDPQPQP